jgi:uncharacterized protein YidB (DUF937 family)
MGLLDDLLDGLAGQGEAAQPAGRAVPRSPAQQSGGGMADIMTALLPVVLAMLANRGGNNPQSRLDQRGGGGGGGGLGDLIGVVLDGGRGSSGSGGGLGDLLSQLQRAGFGAQADSWVGRGQNQPIPPEGMDEVFGREGVSQIARHLGVSEAETRRGLSQLLPEVVDRVTPEGRVPDLDALSASVDALTRRTGRR